MLAKQKGASVHSRSVFTLLLSAQKQQVLVLRQMAKHYLCLFSTPLKKAKVLTMCKHGGQILMSSFRRALPLWRCGKKMGALLGYKKMPLVRRHFP
jgi:hypothetical protein